MKSIAIMPGVELIPLSPRCAAAAPDDLECALALGCFDGFHIAHRAIADAARELAAVSPTMLAGAFCFAQPPAAYFGRPVPMITDTAEKCRLFAAAGLDLAFVADLAAIKDQSAADFIEITLRTLCRCRAVACGFNFSFGRAASGTPAELCRAFGEENTKILPPRLIGDTPISSSRIRSLIDAGEMEAAAELLGRPFSICGEVIHGRGDGKKLGFPTINQLPAEGMLTPPPGVYISRAEIAGGESLPAITDIGTAPTIDKTGVLRYETHLLTPPAGSLYGCSPRVEILHRLRGEVRFPSTAALTEQIEHDVERAREFFGLG